MIFCPEKNIFIKYVLKDDGREEGFKAGKGKKSPVNFSPHSLSYLSFKSQYIDNCTYSEAAQKVQKRYWLHMAWTRRGEVFLMLFFPHPQNP